MSSRLQQGIIALLVILNVGFIGWRLSASDEGALGPGVIAPGAPLGGPLGTPAPGGELGGAGGGLGQQPTGGLGGPPPPGGVMQPALPQGGVNLGPPPGYSAADIFPLAGMPDWQGAAADACPTLARFLDVAEAKLASAQRSSPLTAEQRAALLGTSCSVADPAVQKALQPYRGAFGQAGLPPLPPFLYFGDEAGAGAAPVPGGSPSGGPPPGGPGAGAAGGLAPTAPLPAPGTGVQP